MKNLKVMLIVCVLAFVVLFISAAAEASPKLTPPSQGVKMVQPCGWFWCQEYDANYAEHVNLPNSTANLNNAQSELLREQKTETMKLNLTIGAIVGWIGNIFITAFVGLLIFFLARRK